MKTLKWMTVVAILFATTLSANAQEGKHRHMPDSAQMEERMNKMAEELELTDKQQKEFEVLVAEHKNEVKALREKHKPQRDQHKAEGDALRESFDADVAKILTPEQKTEYDTLKKQRMEKRKGNKDCNCCCCKGKGQGKGQGQGKQ